MVVLLTLVRAELFPCITLLQLRFSSFFSLPFEGFYRYILLRIWLPRACAVALVVVLKTLIRAELFSFISLLQVRSSSCSLLDLYISMCGYAFDFLARVLLYSW